MVVASSTLGSINNSPLFAGIVVVGLEQKRASGTHRAVDEELDRPELEPGARAGLDRRPADELDLAAAWRRGHGVDPQPELAVAVELAIDVGLGLGDARVVNAGQPLQPGSASGRPGSGA